MSASERLRALEREAERLAAERDYDLQLYHSVVDALPLIADVVEAAEKLVAISDPTELSRIRNSLTALREHLDKQ